MQRAFNVSFFSNYSSNDTRQSDVNQPPNMSPFLPTNTTSNHFSKYISFHIYNQILIYQLLIWCQHYGRGTRSSTCSPRRQAQEDLYMTWPHEGLHVTTIMLCHGNLSQGQLQQCSNQLEAVIILLKQLSFSCSSYHSIVDMQLYIKAL